MNKNSNMISVTLLFCKFPSCACNLEPEATCHYFLSCHILQIERRPLINDIKEIDEHILTDHKNDLDQGLIYRNECYRYDTNEIILLSTLKFFIDSRRCDLLLF